MMTPSFPLAFFAGILSFLSPCVLPLVPSYLAYVGGSGASRETPQGGVAAPSMSSARLYSLANSLLFIMGFSLIFIALGASATGISRILFSNRRVLMLFGGLLVSFFGLLMLGVFRIPFFQRDMRLRFEGNTATPLGALLLGMAFGAGWTPCIGPVLGAILTMASTSANIGQGVLLLTMYALGLGVPFFVSALLMDSFLSFSQGFRRYLPWVERVSGGILLLAGIMMLTGMYTAFNGYLLRLTPQWLLERL